MGFLIAGLAEKPDGIKHHLDVSCPLTMTNKTHVACMGAQCPVFEPIKPHAAATDAHYGVGRCGLSRA